MASVLCFLPSTNTLFISDDFRPPEAYIDTVRFVPNSNTSKYIFQCVPLCTSFIAGSNAQYRLNVDFGTFDNRMN